MEATNQQTVTQDTKSSEQSFVRLWNDERTPRFDPWPIKGADRRRYALREAARRKVAHLCYF